MTSKRYLSNKKSRSSQTTISTSFALKDWVSRYVNVQSKNNPKDFRFKSVSAFYNFVMESVLNILEKGKTLEDFKKLVDQDVTNFYDSLTFKAIIPLYESSIEFNSYRDDDVDFVFKLAMRYRNFALEKGSIQADIKILNTLERFKNFMESNNVTRIFNFNVVNNGFIFEYSAHYPNIHFNHTKIIIAIASVMGLKITDILYDKHDCYVRFDAIKTELFNDDQRKLKERKKLFNMNLSYLINDYNIINDKKQHLWIKLSQNLDTIISFKDIDTGIDIIERIIKNIQNIVERKELLETILKIFEKFHWINIIDISTLTFRYLLKEHHINEKEIIKRILNNFSIVKEKDGIISLN